MFASSSTLRRVIPRYRATVSGGTNIRCPAFKLSIFVWKFVQDWGAHQYDARDMVLVAATSSEP